MNAKEKQIVRNRLDKSLNICNSKLNKLNQIHESIKHYYELVEDKLSNSNAELDSVLKNVNKKCLEFEKEIKKV